MPILNSPGPISTEGKDHFQTKVLVGKMADKYLTSLASEVGYALCVTYEFQFKPIWIAEDPIKPRLYSGDVVLVMLRGTDLLEALRSWTWEQLQEVSEFLMDIEIDGTVGHSSKTNKSNNKRRDIELSKVGVAVHRISSFNKRQRESYENEILDELISFFYKSLEYGAKATANNNQGALQ